MPDDRTNPGWFPSWLPDYFPRNTPSVREQLACPSGQHREFRRGGPSFGVCVPDQRDVSGPGRLTEVDEGFVAPTPRPGRPPTVRPVPPKLPSAPPPPTTQPPASQPGPSPVDRSTGRYFPRGRVEPLPTLGRAVTLVGTMSWIWALAFGPSLGYGWRERSLFDPLPSSGPPRRGRVRVHEAVPTPRIDDKFPGGIFPDRRRRTVAPSTPGTRGGPRAVPTQPGPVPRPQPTVRPVPTPTGWTLGNPIPGPGYDPYTYAPPAPAPRRPGRGSPAPGTRALPWPSYLPFAPRGTPGQRPGIVPRTLTPQQPQPRPPRARRPPRVRLPPAPTLTPTQQPVPLSLAQPLRAPTEANPCTEQRTERRRKQQKCREFTTKTIRVCADK